MHGNETSIKTKKQIKNERIRTKTENKSNRERHGEAGKSKRTQDYRHDGNA